MPGLQRLDLLLGDEVALDHFDLVGRDGVGDAACSTSCIEPQPARRGTRRARARAGWRGGMAGMGKRSDMIRRLIGAPL